MADQNPTSDPLPDGAPTHEPSPHPVPPARRHRRWPKVVLLCVVVILLFIAFVPTLLSMGWARRIAENKANAQLRGKLSIGDWSIGWFTGARLGSVNLYDAAGQPVLQLTSIDTHLSISDVLRGNFDLGKVPVTGLRLYITREPDGTLNLQSLLPPKHLLEGKPGRTPQPGNSPPPSPAAPPPKLPNISVDLELSDCQAIFADAQTGQVVTLPIFGSLKIPNINQPIINDLKVAIQGPKGAVAGNIELAGSVAAVHDNQVDSNQPDVDETLTLSDLNLAALQPMFAPGFTTLTGQGGGKFSVRLVPHAAGSVNGAFAIQGIQAAGRATEGDTFSADALTISVPPTALPTADGLDAIATTSDRLTTGTDAGGGPGSAGGVPIEIGLQQNNRQSVVMLNIDAPLSALRNLAKNRAPGAIGKVEVTATAYFASIANQLPHLIRLKPGMTLDSGQLHARAGVAMTPAQATPTASLAIDDVAGKYAGKTVALKPISISASVDDLPSGGVMPTLQNLQAQFTSVFATGSVSAPTPSQIHGEFTAQLADMQKELGQVFDFGSSAISGGIVATLSSQAGENTDPAADKSSAIQGSLVASNLRIDRGGGGGKGAAPAIDIPAAKYTLAGTIYHDASLSIKKITGLDLAGAVGPADRPALATHLSADLAFGKNSSVVASNVNLSQTINVPELRRELGSSDTSEKIPADYAVKFVLAADQSVSTAGGVTTARGSIHGNVAISDNGAADFVEPDLSLVDDVSYDRARSVADLTNLSLDMHSTGALRLALRGKISDLSARRELKGVSATLHYDAGGLWKLIYATLTPEQRESYKDVKLSGTVDREFVASGSYPADRPFAQAVKSLVVQGGIAVPSFQGEGMTIANLDLPLSIKNGLLFIAEPTPATMNDGTMSLNGTTVDLSDPHPRLSIPAGTTLFKNVSLNPVFVKNAAGWVNNPLFSGTDKAAGILNVTIDHCDRLPADNLVKATTPDNDGTFHAHMTLGRVQLGAPMLANVSKAIGPILGGNIEAPTLEGEIPNYTLDIAKGIMTTDMAMDLTAKKRPLKLAGTVALASEKLNMTLDLPTALFGGDNGPLAEVAGDSLAIPITGTVDRPQFQVKKLVQKNLKNPGKELKNIFKGIGG